MIFKHVLLLLFAAIGPLSAPSLGFSQDEEGVVLEEEGVVVEEGVVAAEEGAPVPGWNALPVVAREVEGQRVFMRQSSDAFADPDQRLSLEPKYFFVLEADAIPEFKSFRKGPQPEGKHDQTSYAEWLDYNAKPPTTTVALGTSPSPTLLVQKSGASKQEKQRELEGEVVSCAAPLDTWDISPDWKSKSALLSRVIAVLKCVDDRYCVDFYSASLNPDSDCRVWLTPRDHEFGAPRGIAFIDLPIVKEDKQAKPVSVLAVQFENQAIAIDFPLCRPALMEQMQKMAANRPSKPGQEAKGPDLTKLVGPDLLEEFARRLVNGTYR